MSSVVLSGNLGRTPKRSTQTSQFELLREALGDVNISSSSGYTPQIVILLREAILSLRLMPGTPLSEAVIAKVLRVSRTPVREAIKELANENLLDIFPQAGTVVAPIRLSLVEQGTFVRHALELANILDLATKMTPDFKARIDHVLAAQKVALDALDYQQFFVHDEALHQLFFELTQRLPIWNIVNLSKQQVNRARRLLAREVAETVHRAYQEHLAIGDALYRNDTQQIAREMYNHVGNLKAIALEYAINTHSSYFVD